ncbi:MAG: hypothetical protein CVU84_05275 [Firmicutes bacterium HGW-Firmicutes-1]|jgi:hypothetical protein|nr:MAG: hypothetical protein CVU84_05275 [Firmicutes bacterium HGW-Firmicutes-1]
MNTLGNQKKASIGLITGFAILFTPLFFVGIAIIIGSLIYAAIQKGGRKHADENGEDTISELLHQRAARKLDTEGSIMKHNRTKESFERMSKEDEKNYSHYKNIKNTYEQTVTPILIKKNNSNKCEVCRTIHTKPIKYCEICGELFGDGLKCTFCSVKNELNAEYCKNCGVKFKG